MSSQSPTIPATTKPVIKENIRWYLDILIVLLHKELTVRYKNSVLGYLWSLMNPLMLAAVFYVVFSVYMRFNIPNYLIVLLSALFPWQWLNNSVGQAPFLFLANATLVKKVCFPRYIIPLVTTLHDMIHFLLALPIFIFFSILHGIYPTASWLYGLPLLLLVSCVFIFGLSLMISSINLFFRDLNNIIVILLNIAFYATPIIYSIDTVPADKLKYFVINPVAPLFISWRSLLHGNRIDMQYLPWAIGYAVVSLIVGWVVYSRLNKKFAEVI